MCKIIVFLTVNSGINHILRKDGKQILPIIKEVESFDPDYENLFYEIISEIWNRDSALAVDFSDISLWEIEKGELENGTSGNWNKRKYILVRAAMPDKLAFTANSEQKLTSMNLEDIRGMLETGSVEGKEVRLDPPHRKFIRTLVEAQVLPANISP